MFMAAGAALDAAPARRAAVEWPGAGSLRSAPGAHAAARSAPKESFPSLCRLVPGDSLAVYSVAGAALGAAPVVAAAPIVRPELVSGLMPRLVSLPRLDLSPDATDTAYFNVTVKARRAQPIAAQ